MIHKVDKIINGEKITITYNAYCTHPELDGNSATSIGCRVKCSTCSYCKAELDYATFEKLLGGNTNDI